MEVVVLIICLVVFFFCLYRLGRDDYVLIRKNISMEKLFDLGFLAVFSGLFFSRVIFLIFHRVEGENIFLQFFSPSFSDFTLSGIMVGGWVWTYLVGKYKRYPLGRIFDFFSLALVAVLPIGYWGLGWGISDIVQGFVYLILSVIYWQLLYSRLMSTKLREGLLATIFLFCFLMISLGERLLVYLRGGKFIVVPEDFCLVMVCILTGVLVLRQGKKGKR